MVTMPAPQATTARWGHSTFGHRHASRPPIATKTRKPKWTRTTASARSRYTTTDDRTPGSARPPDRRPGSGGTGGEGDVEGGGGWGGGAVEGHQAGGVVAADGVLAEPRVAGQERLGDERAMALRGHLEVDVGRAEGVAAERGQEATDRPVLLHLVGRRHHGGHRIAAARPRGEDAPGAGRRGARWGPAGPPRPPRWAPRGRGPPPAPVTRPCSTIRSPGSSSPASEATPSSAGSTGASRQKGPGTLVGLDPSPACSCRS